MTVFVARFAAENGPPMVPIAPGEFTMGSTNGSPHEKPPHRVTILRPFFLGATELTQAQWVAVMGSNPSIFKGDTLPVDYVSWEEAMSFCKKLTEQERAAGRLPAGWEFTLPTEAQWEYACRACTSGDYAGDLDAMAWWGNNSGNKTHAAGTKQANAWGLYDMHGNVWEWCLDWYEDYVGENVTEPAGAASGSRRALRGGGKDQNALSCRSAVRDGGEPRLHNGKIGFRLALAPLPHALTAKEADIAAAILAEQAGC